MYGLRKFWIQVVDELGEPITSGLTVSVAATTIYADEYQTSLTNPITTTTNGVVEFWYAASTVDVIVSTATVGGPSAKRTLSAATAEHRIVLPQHQNILEKSLPPVEFFDDFVGMAAIAAGAEGDQWALASDGGGTATVADAPDGVLELLTGGTDEDGATLSSTPEFVQCQTDKNFFFEIRMKVTEQDSTNYDSSWCVGISDLATVGLMQAAGAGPDASHTGILFFKVEANKFIEFETATAGAEGELSDMLAFVTDTWYRLGFKYDYNDGVTGKVTPYINGTAYAPQDFTIAATCMHLVMSIKTHGTQTETMDVDYIRFVADRDD